MRIGLSTSTLESAAAGGIADGIAHYTQQLKHGLEAIGHTVVPYAFSSASKRHGKSLQFSESIVGGFALLGGVGILTGGRAKLFAPEVDVFHSTDFKVVPTRCPVVATLWDAIPVIHPEWLSARTRLIAPPVLRRVAQFADRVICASDHAAGDVVRHLGVNAAKISIVPWGIEDSWLTPMEGPEVDDALNKYNLTRGYFLTVGTIQPRKNIGTLLAAYRRLPKSVRNDHSLVIVGRLGWGADALTEELEALASAGSVRWLKHVASDHEIRRIYHGAHVFVLPSLYEGFGIPVLEAFSSGVPVVSSNATSLPEVCGGAALEVDPLDVGALSEAMATLAVNTTERATCCARGHVRARQLTVSKAVERTVEVYELASQSS